MQRCNNFGTVLLELIKLLDGIHGARHLEPYPFLLQILLRRLWYFHAPIITGPDDNNVRIGGNDLCKILNCQVMSVLAPPIIFHPVRGDYNIRMIAFVIDINCAECVVSDFHVLFVIVKPEYQQTPPSSWSPRYLQEWI